MVLVEVSYLSEKNKIEISLQTVLSYCSNYENIFIQNLDTDLIKSAFEINDIPELHDRLIPASGKNLNAPIITNDPKIISSKFVSTVWK